MSDIGKGDWVECIQSKKLAIGALYRVREVVAEEKQCVCHGFAPFGLCLEGRTNDVGYAAWCGLNFRPIYRPKQEIIEALKALPKRVKERV